MNLEFSPEELAFRDEVRTFIAENYPQDLRGKQDEGDELGKEDFLSWHRILHKKGWVAPAWPVEYGGTGWTATQKYIWSEETARADCIRLMPFGLAMVGPVIYTFGTPEQKAKFLPGILSGDDWWCQGYSEPGSGSDLVSLQTFGEDKGDHWVVNGSKIWTSYADKADWIFCLVRTDKANKYQGITFMLFDMESKGVTTKPILLISGNSPFCETFFDDVEVPKTQFVGELNRGWDVAKYLLGHEREMISGMGGDGGTASLGGGFKDALADEPVLRAQLALFDVESLAFRAHSERFMDEWKTGKAHPAYSNLMKYIGTELNKKRHELVMAAGGTDYLEWESEASNGGKRARDWLRTKANSIEGGTSEVMLGIVAKRILNLPGA